MSVRALLGETHKYIHDVTCEESASILREGDYLYHPDTEDLLRVTEDYALPYHICCRSIGDDKRHCLTVEQILGYQIFRSLEVLRQKKEPAEPSDAQQLRSLFERMRSTISCETCKFASTFTCNNSSAPFYTRINNKGEDQDYGCWYWEAKDPTTEEQGNVR